MKTIEDIKGTIAKLLALADSPNEHEAQVALLKARELMAKHKLRPEEVAKKQNVKVLRRLIGISCTTMTDTWAAHLSAIIAEHYCCKAYREHMRGAKKVEIGLIGLEEDFEICEKVFKYAFESVAAQCKRLRAEYKADYTAAIVRQITNSYGTGFCGGLKAAYAAQDQEHQEYSLVLVTPQAVVDAMADMGKPRGYGNISTDGWRRNFAAQGYQDGIKFDPSTKLPQPATNKMTADPS